jgi:3-hydroxymyristoyl/3-hydroxydecanoyl-(acyl carrier protein) dehydratase
MLLTAVSLDSGSFPGILIMLGVHNDEVFAQMSGGATTNLEVSYTELGVLSGSFHFILFL